MTDLSRRKLLGTALGSATGYAICPIAAAQKSTLFKEDFERRSVGEVPDEFILAGNTTQSVTNTTAAVGNKSYRMRGSHGGCWEAIFRQELFDNRSRTNRIQVSGQFRLGRGSVGCHSSCGDIMLLTTAGTSWSDGKSVPLLRFYPDGHVESLGEYVGEYNKDQWNQFEIKYYWHENDKEVTQYCTVNNNSTKKIVRDARTYESKLTAIGLQSGDFTVFWDDLLVETIDAEESELKNALIAHWPLENDLSDPVGDHNISVSSGNPTFGTYDGRAAMALDGDEKLRISRGGHGELSLAGKDENPFTISSWIYFDSPTGQEPFEGTGTPYHSIYKNDTGIRIVGVADPGDQAVEIRCSISPYGDTAEKKGYSMPDNANVLVPIKEWHHFACVVDPGNSLEIFIDGDSIFIDNSMNGYNNPSNDFWTDITIGSWYGGNPEEWANLMNGKLSDFRIYDTGLSERQVATLAEGSEDGVPTYPELADIQETHVKVAQQLSQATVTNLRVGQSDLPLIQHAQAVNDAYTNAVQADNISVDSAVDALNRLKTSLGTTKVAAAHYGGYPESGGDESQYDLTRNMSKPVISTGLELLISITGVVDAIASKAGGWIDGKLGAIGGPALKFAKSKANSAVTHIVETVLQRAKSFINEPMEKAAQEIGKSLATGATFSAIQTTFDEKVSTLNETVSYAIQARTEQNPAELLLSSNPIEGFSIPSEIEKGVDSMQSFTLNSGVDFAYVSFDPESVKTEGLQGTQDVALDQLYDAQRSIEQEAVNTSNIIDKAEEWSNNHSLLKNTHDVIKEIRNSNLPSIPMIAHEFYAIIKSFVGDIGSAFASGAGVAALIKMNITQYIGIFESQRGEKI